MRCGSAARRLNRAIRDSEAKITIMSDVAASEQESLLQNEETEHIALLGQVSSREHIVSSFHLDRRHVTKLSELKSDFTSPRLRTKKQNSFSGIQRTYTLLPFHLMDVLLRLDVTIIWFGYGILGRANVPERWRDILIKSTVGRTLRTG